ncbi:MAG: hypothetical protein Greene041662_1006 [Candidatus Peregrinibacteria bacterium Greene0416_62]|nr:MAG: hypothetical protein Greene041662_1006 [Candidatus Peregrinibacteria bacterium Greene0416_62]TSD00014.1 MAG: hypothetical protein Greene101449_374 [Candidatus Peregrinibacteria bacterium Greene1014_49]
MNGFLLLEHTLLRIGLVIALCVIIGWIRHNDAKRERRRLQAQGDLHGEE